MFRINASHFIPSRHFALAYCGGQVIAAGRPRPRIELTNNKPKTVPMRRSRIR